MLDIVTLQLEEDDDLNPYEAWARDRLTPILGPLRRIDRRGGPEGLHDFEADLADGSVAALEVTGEVDAQRLSLASSAERRLSSITLHGSSSLWLVGLAADAKVSTIKPNDLRRLLSELEASGRRSAHTKEKAECWTRRRAFAQVRQGSNIQLLSYSLVT